MSIKSKFLACSALVFCLTTATIPLSAKAIPVAPPIEVAQATAQLTEEDVQAVIDLLQAARDNRDIEGTLELMAPFAVTVVTVESGNGLSTITTHLEGMDAHRQMLEQSFSQVQSRESLKNYVTIDIIDDNFGLAKIYQMETFETSAGEAWIAASQTVLRLGRVDGQVLVTSATVDGWISARPSQD
ncbi:hypothetical protein VB780_05665 [Leptolyngbya sp. CCNP1308]|uniref:hypothetical protein n=1 Tax=Leptolyngbya sp. CCNP1308 TaxID=3110255 RepID=UPI002B1F18A1|nr:hypothetical protein [Leptolyngbya sp. CCNP1308]MEA5448047.1 hypothetical protein [Leptolyngbya sp. CCNP1308]